MTRDAYIDKQGVTLFAGAMLEKMNVARRKGRSGWDDSTQCSAEDLNRMLHEHLAKGDPVDVANFCMMLWNRGEKVTALRAPPETVSVPVEPTDSLLLRASRQLREWHAKYGEHQPGWLPPSGDVKLLEDIDTALTGKKEHF